MNTPVADDALARATAVITRHPDIKLALVHGSVARGRARVDSDIADASTCRLH